MRDNTVKIDDESAEVDFTVTSDIVTDAGPLEIGSCCWNVIDAQGEEFLLTVPIPLDVLNDEDQVVGLEDLDYLFLILQWYKRRSRMQQIMAVSDGALLNVLAVCGLYDEREAQSIAARYNQDFWRRVLQALIDYYTTFPINTEPRLGDCCPECSGHGRRPPRRKPGRPVKCIPCRGTGALPTLQELSEALEAGNG